MNRTELEAYLQQKQPEQGDIRIRDFQEITDGWETDIYSFDMERSLNGERIAEKLVLRLYSGPWAKEKADTEFNLLQRLYQVGYPVPKVSLLEENSTYLGAPFIIMERIEGHQMWSLMDNPQSKLDFFGMFSQLFYDLHQLDWRRLVENPDRYLDLDSKSAALQWIEKYESRIRKINRPELLEIVDWLKVEIDNIAFEELSATHNDFHPNNILIDHDGNPFVIDWTAASLHDYRVDIAWTILLARIYVGEEFHEAILNGYEKMSQKKIEDLHFFEVIGALRRLTDILVSLGADSEDIGLRSGAADMIREQLSQNMTLLDIVQAQTGLKLPAIRKILGTQMT